MNTNETNVSRNGNIGTRSITFMLDLRKGVLTEFTERSYYQCVTCTLNAKEQSTIQKRELSAGGWGWSNARLRGSTTSPRQVMDQDGVVHPSIRAAARAHGVSDTTVRRMLRSPGKSFR